MFPASVNTVRNATPAQECVPDRNSKVICSMPDDTMTGEINIGDKVVIDTTVSRYLEDGIFAFYIHGTFMIKRLQFLPDEIRVVPASKHYQTWNITDHQDNGLVIIGRVIASQQVKAH
jgi:phage repressor protein C with HTH and peptisase S24 domain